ncbi:MAG: hypothetical protein HKP30_12925 [Myxococcales bacterium]|nr:hypothetical protein [Myxococcales bacterium]
MVVHLVGILKESATTSYGEAHETSCFSLTQAAEQVGVQRIVYLSILGSRPDAKNPCLASKGRAEAILLERETQSLVLRVPMVIGRGDPASRALRGQANAGLLPLIGGGRSLEQPIDADDVVAAIASALVEPAVANQALDLAGPESLPSRDLVRRAAALYGKTPRIVPIPEGLARLGVRLLERFASEPPVTSAMLDVLLHDDDIDPEPAARALGIRLTPLDAMLARRVGPTKEST